VTEWGRWRAKATAVGRVCKTPRAITEQLHNKWCRKSLLDSCTSTDMTLSGRYREQAKVGYRRSASPVDHVGARPIAV
jgi:hypothetical protein